MVTRRSRIIAPTAYMRPDIVMRPRPEVEIPPRPDIEISALTAPLAPSEEPKIDVILFSLPPSCVIGNTCEGTITLKNNTDGTLDGFINVGMQGAMPVMPTVYSIPAGATETVVFTIPTEGLTITGTYVLELEMYVGTEVVATASGNLEILPLPEYEITINSEPSSATVEVTEVLK